jgi:hypothetical protein
MIITKKVIGGKQFPQSFDLQAMVFTQIVAKVSQKKLMSKSFSKIMEKIP